MNDLTIPFDGEAALKARLALLLEMLWRQECS